MEAPMFGSRRKTVIAKGLKIEGRVTAEGLVELNGQIEGELHGKSLIISRGAFVKGAVSADQVVVDGTIEGPITGREIILKSRAHVIGDIHHQFLSIENGASFEGRSVQTGVKSDVAEPGEAVPQPSGKKPGKKAAQDGNGDTSAGGDADEGSL
jgi:cytoskeletal protein CcmA (bactofilin family)